MSPPSALWKRCLAGVVILAAMLALVSLGVWQLQRKTWKESLISDINSRAHAVVTELPSENSWPSWNAAADEFRHVTVSGTYLHDWETPVYGLMQTAQLGAGQNATGSVQGSYIFTPLLLDNGAIIFINRGFVPDGQMDAVSHPGEHVQVSGILRAPEKRGWFVPENNPEKGKWYTRASNAMAAYYQFERPAPFYLEADAQPKASEAVSWPQGGVTRTITLKNDHLQYALTWFGLALTLFGVSAWSVFRK